ncbi:hypothetical protein B0H19DRAFT_1254702 [Mycena capillaripes]|nr:hypothetical protein B0H19DRAFT_1254702 [Mycena capillaripes]
MNGVVSSGSDVASLGSSTSVRDILVLTPSTRLTKYDLFQVSSNSSVSISVSAQTIAASSTIISGTPTAISSSSILSMPSSASGPSIQPSNSSSHTTSSWIYANKLVARENWTQSSNAFRLAEFHGTRCSSGFPSSVPPPTSLSDVVKPSSVAKPSSSSRTSSVVETSASPGSTKASPINPTNPTGHASSPVPPTIAHAPPVSFTGTTTSTITDAPESTLAKPSFIPSVDSNGKTSFTAPPLVTILSTSQESNGSFVTFTHVVANPTGFGQAIAGGRASFFHNAGAVAGVFLVVGALLTAAAAFGIFILCRRRRRRRERHRRWLVSVNRPRPVADGSQDPFEDPRISPSPPMRVVPHAYTWDTQVPAPHQMAPSGLGLYGVPQMHQNEHVEEQQHYHAMDRNEIGLAITTNESKPSLAQSSPSIYPPSLPPTNDEEHIFEETYSQPQPRRISDASAAPPRPRRSHLRVASPKAQLATPPSSVSSHDPSPISEFGSPFGFTSAEELSPAQQGQSRLNEIIGRRTLLDIRPRSQDSVATVSGKMTHQRV